MTPDDQPAAPGGLHPETAVICAGRPGHAAGGPLNTPIVLASNFHADADTGQDSRAYPRTDATPGREALGTAVGQVEGGHAVAFSSGRPRSPPCSTSCRPAAASSPPRTATSASASFSPTPGSTAAGPSTAWT